MSPYPTVADSSFSANPGGREWVKCKYHTVEQYIIDSCKYYYDKWRITEAKADR